MIWDCHCHLSGVGGATAEERTSELLRYADRVGIERLVVSMGVNWSHDPSPDHVRRQNDDVLRAVEAGKGRVLGFVLLNPKYAQESLAELDRCVHDGPMVGVKLWVAMKCNDPRIDPIVRRSVELKAPILQHTYFRLGGNLAGESSPDDLAALAARHPDAIFISAHTGNDWERGTRAVRAVKNVSTDICGCDPTSYMVDMAVRELGAERVLYGSDAGGRSYASQLGKVYGADITDEEKRLILGLNLRRLLEPILKSKGMQL
ncbi:MAG: amidohydrolase [Pirellulales bacterium]|nr:amidohydrolase [Pirellulales bacterium]